MEKGNKSSKQFVRFVFNHLSLFIYLGGLMYLNLVLGNQDGFRNLTTQIQNLTSDVGLYRDEIISKIEVRIFCMY